jgi:hypothetical protein
MAETEDKGGSKPNEQTEQQDDAAKAAAPEEGSSEGAGEIRAGDAFKKGMGLLWQAARTAADEIKREVEKGHVTETLQQAGKELESAAHHAAKALEDFIGRASPKPPKYEDKWPPEGAAKDEAAQPKQADADIPKDGGTDEKGERRDMRIQVEEDKKK